MKRKPPIFTLGVGIISGDMTGVDAAAAVTKVLKSKGLTLFTVELFDDDEDDEEDDEDDGGVQFWSMLKSLACGDRAGGVTVVGGMSC